MIYPIPPKQICNCHGNGVIVLFIWNAYRGVLHSRNVVDDFRNLFGNVQKFRNLEIRNTFKAKFDWFCGARNSLYDRDLQELVILLRLQWSIDHQYMLFNTRCKNKSDSHYHYRHPHYKRTTTSSIHIVRNLLHTLFILWKDSG